VTSRRDFLFAALAAGLPALPAQAQTARRFTKAAAFNAERRGVSFVVMRNGVVIGEDYPNGGAMAAQLNLRSGTKSFTPMIAAAMVRDRLLELDEPVAFTLGEWGAHPRKNRITVRQLLNLTSGIAVPLVSGAAPTTAESIAAEPVDEPGARFVYSNAPFQIFGEVVRRKLSNLGDDSDPGAYLQRRVLDPVGCYPVDWRRGPDGHAWLSTGAATNARAWARYGEFMRRAGIWRARALVSSRALGESVLGTSVSGYRYGLGWWVSPPGSEARDARALTQLADLYAPGANAPFDGVYAMGAGDQRLYILPGRGLVVVRQAPDTVDRNAPKWSDAEFLRLVVSDL
jgi:CubicO group peptidase (beta-lactamase class C family)